ncbi:SpoIIE family protein phosphatase [Streptomyces sp. JJ36]|uniref:SpoIIE family protein phosphatase n=1 Tax=Streptomyces sp. JJ36 TaxID=2736645 RepID=UPI001F0253EB|nr:SpoIIE family protein phosphatase [Streptomyces sp. JJ36]MCF6525631.1 SpoIIE family protein phosphatase [Streptomyces sp. JJ36]
MTTWDTAEGGDLRGPLDLTKAATAVLDARDVVLGWSPRAEELLGYPAEEVLGTPLHRLLAVPARLDGAGPLGGDGGPDGRGEDIDLRHRDGHPVRVAVTRSFLSPSPRGPVSVLLAARVTEVREWEIHQAMLRALLDQSPIGLTVYGTDLRVRWANATCKRELAGPPENYVGCGPDELVPGGQIIAGSSAGNLRELVQGVLETGAPVVELHYRGRPPEDPAHDRIWSYSYYRLLGPGGEPLGVCEESYDITERYRAQQRLQLLVRAGEHIGTTLDLYRTAEELAEVAVPQFAEAAFVDLFPDVLEGGESGSSAPRSRPLVRVASRAAPGAGEAVTVLPETPVGRHPRYPGESPQARSLAAGGPVLEPAPDEEPGGPAAVLRTLAVPVRARGAAMGVVTFLRGDRHDPFDSDELALADELVRRTAVSVDNAWRYATEHTAALTLQRSLLPRSLPPQTAVETAYRYLPADSRVGVGGDWFDVIPLSGTRVGLVVGDVVGHGLRAAATMGRLRTTVRALAQLDLAPDELLSRLDDLVTQTDEERALVDPGPEPAPDDAALGVTCLYAVYDPVSQRCVLARAGHPLPAVVGADGGVAFPELPAGPPLGTGGLPFESAEIELPEGSLLALFTDGLVEARDLDVGEGLYRLRDVLSGHRRGLEELCDRVLGVLPSGSTTDDAALLLVRTRALNSDQVAAWEIAADPAAVSDVRTEVGGRLHDWGLDELEFGTELVVSELVTNAIRYAGGPIHLRLIRDRTLICEVSDTGHTSPHLRHAESEDEGGRGLFLVAQLTQRWGTRYTSAGKVIWAEQPLPPKP